MADSNMPSIHPLTIALALLVILLEAVIYVLFEFQNAWPYNEDLFLVLRIVSLGGIAISGFFAIIYPRPYISLLSLLLSIFATTMISRSGINLTSLAVNFLAVFLIFLSARKLASMSGGKVGASQL